MNRIDSLLLFSVVALFSLLVACSDKVVDKVASPSSENLTEAAEVDEAAGSIFSVVPRTLDFGNVAVGTTSTKQWTIRNNGARQLIVSSFIGDTSATTPKKAKTGGTCGSLPWVLDPGEECYINMVFKPARSGQVQRTFSFGVNIAPTIRTRNAIGVGGGGNGGGALMGVNDDHAGGIITIGIATIANRGTGFMNISSVSFQSSNLNLDADRCTGKSLATNRKCEVTYGPCCNGCGTSIGSGTFTILSNASNSPFSFKVECEQ